MGRRTGGAINSTHAVIPVFTPDPRGHDTFAGLSAVHQLGLTGHTGIVYTGDRGSAEKSFNGDLGHQLQHFTGEAALALYGGAKPIHEHSGELAGALSQDTLNDPALRIFAARARRQAGAGL